MDLGTSRLAWESSHSLCLVPMRRIRCCKWGMLVNYCCARDSISSASKRGHSRTLPRPGSVQQRANFCRRIWFRENYQNQCCEVELLGNSHSRCTPAGKILHSETAAQTMRVRSFISRRFLQAFFNAYASFSQSGRLGTTSSYSRSRNKRRSLAKSVTHSAFDRICRALILRSNKGRSDVPWTFANDRLGSVAETRGGLAFGRETDFTLRTASLRRAIIDPGSSRQSNRRK